MFNKSVKIICVGVGVNEGVNKTEHTWLPELKQVDGGNGNPWKARYIEVGRWCRNCGKTKKS
jgi:hypothetical protein